MTKALCILSADESPELARAPALRTAWPAVRFATAIHPHRAGAFAGKPDRAAAIVVLVLTIGKVFLHDLWNLGALYRVGSIVGLALALLAVSFLTQRFVLARDEP